MKKTLFLLTLALSLSLASTAPVRAKEVACTGVNLLERLKKTDPKKVDIIEHEASRLPYGEGLLWKLSKPGFSPSYLFGTMHMSDPRVVELTDSAQQAFDESKTLALEITEILDPKALASKAMVLMKYTTYLDGTSLDTKLNKQQIALIDPKLTKKTGLPWTITKRMRPWVLMGMLSMPACELARKNSGEPFLDMSLGQKAKQAGKNIVGLETIESQMDIMASLPEAMMVKALVETAKMGSTLDDVFETMIQLYKQERIGTIWAMVRHMGPNGLQTEVDATGYAEFQRVVVDDRNIKMAAESIKLMEKGSTFIAVGALHLPGEKGILSILAQKGFIITRK